MNLFKKVLIVIITLTVAVGLIACKDDELPREADERDLTSQEYTINNIVATDALGRMALPGDQRNGKYIGLFYHIWHGFHTTGLYNISELLEMNPDSLYDIDGDLFSPVGAFHYWGEPLYGYYQSSDPWVVTRHIELLTMIGIDYLVYDLTNSVIYIDAINTIFEVLDQFYQQGFDVPKVVFYTNSHSRVTINRLWELWFEEGKYEHLWFSFDEKPLIIGVSSELRPDERELYFDFFDFRESQWPFGHDEDLDRGFPWMDWKFPQTIFNDGTISVSLAQHPGARMSEGARSNYGRGFDYSTFSNHSNLVSEGSNYRGQWSTVFNNLDTVNNVFITGFNEWIAIKYEDGQEIFFVDTFNEEYSRDIEMSKKGYQDNYLIQTLKYAREFAFDAPKHYIYEQNTIDITDETLAQWSSVATNFKDFAGDAMARNFRNAASTFNYTDNSNRNDITDVSITHDQNHLYIKVETVDPITAYNGTDLNWMNILLKTKNDVPSFAGYNYIVNRNPGTNQTSLEKSTGGYVWEKTADIDMHVFGNVMMVKIPLSQLGLKGNQIYVEFKIADNVTRYDEIMDYYITGDSAPIGRFSYVYGY